MVINFIDIYKKYVSALNEKGQNKSPMSEEIQNMIRRCRKLEEWMLNADMQKFEKSKAKKVKSIDER